LCAHSAKSFSENDVAPSKVINDNAAENNTREEEKAVTAAEVAAPARTVVVAAADDSKAITPNELSHLCLSPRTSVKEDTLFYLLAPSCILFRFTPVPPLIPLL
jgi:hypothetical protein